MPKAVFYIKLIHSLLFFLIAICTAYTLYSALFDQITGLTWWAFSVAMVEMLVLVFNNWECPITGIEEKRTKKEGSVVRLFLPTWFYDHLFTIFGVVFSVACLLLIWRIIE